MSDYHILPDNRIVLHVAVPAAAGNSVGVNFRQLLVAFGRNTTSLTDAVDDANPKGWEITVAEKAQIAAGEVLEHSRAYDLSKLAGTLADKRTALLALIALWTPKILADASERLEYVGHAGSVS